MRPRYVVATLFCILALPSVAAEKEALKPPAVTMQATPRSGRLEKDHDLVVVLVVANSSERELRNLALIPDPGGTFSIVGKTNLPGSLPPFRSFAGSITVRPRADVPFGPHNMILGVRYAWSADGRIDFVSMQTATVPIEVRRPFEDEAKGLPGGTAALFYLLLPVFPAFFAYQFVDRLRKGEGAQMPTFANDYILPASLIGLLANALRVRYSLLTVVIGAAILGAFWPALRWALEAWRWKKWAFTPGDSNAEYLRKALLSRWTPRRYVNITGEALGEVWSGVGLAQPDGTLVLGATLQVTPQQESDRQSVDALVNEINGGDRKSRQQLMSLVWQGSVTLIRLVNVSRGGKQQPEIVATDLAGFEQQSASAANLLEVTG